MADNPTIAELVRLADKAALRCSGPHGPLHLAAAALWARGQAILRPMQVSIDVGTYVSSRADKSRRTQAAEYTECGFYTRALEIKEDWLLDRLPIVMAEREPLFLFLDQARYSVEECEKTGRNVEDSMHGTAMLIWPVGTADWHIYHYNPHGRAATDATEHERYITRSRAQCTQLDAPLDSIVIGILVERLRERLPGVSITYAWGRDAHNYYGPNLQVADGLGMCFAHAFLMFYNLGCGSHRNSVQLHARGSIRRFPPTRRLLARGSFHKACTLAALGEHSPLAALRALEGDGDSAEELIATAGQALLARILQAVVRTAVPVLSREVHAHPNVMEVGATEEALEILLARAEEELPNINDAGGHGQEGKAAGLH